MSQKRPQSKAVLVGGGILVAAAVVIAVYFAANRRTPVEDASSQPANVSAVEPSSSNPGDVTGTSNSDPERSSQSASGSPVETSLALDEATFGKILDALLDTKLVKKPSNEVLALFSSLGFTLQSARTSNEYTGTRIVNKQNEPHLGMFDVNVQYVSDSSGKETLEGIRMSISSRDGAFEKNVDKVRQQLGAGWKQVQKSDSSITWVGPDGYIFWMKQYSDKTPPPAGGNPNIVRMGLEPSND